MVSPDQPISATPRARTTILLVDDQRFVGLALARLLDPESGFELHCCERGDEALATADRLRPDLILQDLVLPDADGLTLVANFRRHAATASTPVVVLSGNDDGATRARALAAGAADYLVKLPSKDALIACLDRHLSSAAAAEPAEGWRADEGCSDAPLDQTFLDEYRDAGSDDPDAALRELVDMFLRDADVLMTALRAAVAAADAVAAGRSAHALKGCAMAVGARHLAELCARLETVDVPAHTRLIAGLEGEWLRVKTACAAVAVR